MSFANPLKTLKVTGGFRTRLRPGHAATDYRAPTGTPLYASIDGTVRAGTGHRLAGTWVEIDGTEGRDKLMVGYNHLSRLSVRSGQSVKAGQLIGHSGNTGRSIAAHLHFYVEVDRRRVNPHTWLQQVMRPKPKSGKTTADWLNRKQIKSLQVGLRRTFPAYRWKVRVKRGRLITVDGFDGPQTQAWVKLFQKLTGLKQDGIVGPVTTKELAKYGIRL